jgi:hypothetical protein
MKSKIFILIFRMVIMNPVVFDMTKNKGTKTKLINFLKENNIAFESTNCCGTEKICISFDRKNGACKNHCCHNDIVVRTIDNDVYRIHPNEIIYITVEKRTSILFVDRKTIKVNLPLRYWKEILNPEMFTQPHNSYIVNLLYVEDVSEGMVNLKYKGQSYSVYASNRKIPGFKQKVLDFGNKD